MKAYSCHSCEVNYKAYSPSCHSCEVSLRANAGISIFKLDKISFIVSRYEIIDSGIWSQTPKTGMTAENLLSKTCRSEIKAGNSAIDKYKAANYERKSIM